MNSYKAATVLYPLFQHIPAFVFNRCDNTIWLLNSCRAIRKATSNSDQSVDYIEGNVAKEVCARYVHLVV